MLREQLQALQAIDVGLYKDSGKVIVIARVAGQDVVKVIDVKPGWTPTQYRELVRQVEALYGVDPRWVDAGTGTGGLQLGEYLRRER